MTKFQYIKTRVNTNTKAGKAAQGVAGWTVAECEQLLKGDRKLAQKLYSMRKEGDIAELLLPALEQTVGQKIKNEKDWNKFLAQMTKDGSVAEVDIQKSMNTASMANMKFVHGMKENTEAYQAEVALERENHKWTIDYNRAKLIVDLIVKKVDGENKILEQGSKLYQKQLAENDAYEVEALETITKYGEEGLKTIHKRDYVGEVRKPGLFKRVANVFGI